MRMRMRRTVVLTRTLWTRRINLRRYIWKKDNVRIKKHLEYVVLHINVSANDFVNEELRRMMRWMLR